MECDELTVVDCKHTNSESCYLFDEYGEALVLEGFREVYRVGSLRVDGQWRNYHV